MNALIHMWHTSCHIWMHVSSTLPYKRDYFLQKSPIKETISRKRDLRRDIYIHNLCHIWMHMYSWMWHPHETWLWHDYECTCILRCDTRLWMQMSTYECTCILGCHIYIHDLRHIDWKITPPPGGFHIYHVPWSRTQRKRKRTPLKGFVPDTSRGVLILWVLDQGTW